MKIARFLSVPLLGLFVVTTWAYADPPTADPTTDPNLQYDADGIPLSVTQHQAKRYTPEEIDAIHKQQEQAALNKNWLVRNYEQQLQVRAAANSSGDPDGNLYYRLSANKDLAKLAGLPALDADGQDPTAALRTGVTPSGSGSVTLRPTTTPTATGSPSPYSSILKPLITPLSAPDAAGLHNFYSSLPVSMPSPFSGKLPPAPPPSRAGQSTDTSDIETPGMIAAEKDPLMDSSFTDLSLDVLPGESAEQAKARRDTSNSLTLPLPSNADQLHKAQAASLNVTGIQTTTPTASATTPPVNTTPIEDPDAPMPVSKAPQINPVRAPISNPYDILNR